MATLAPPKPKTRRRVFKILLADDVKLFLEVEKTFFLRSGYKVFTALAGDEVLTMAERNKPDLILLDYEMPGMKGDEICRLLKANPATRAIPILLVSQHYSQDILDRCIRAGCEDYFTKPLDQVQILRRVAEILNISNRRHMRAEVRVTIDRGITKTQFLGNAKNISESGIFLESPCPLEIGRVFQLSFRLPRLDEPVSGRGEVVRVVGRERSGLYGAGIRFLDMADQTVDRIRAFVELQTR